MLSKLQELYKDEQGSYFVEIGLALIVITLTIVSHVGKLASEGINPKFDSIEAELETVSVPDMNP